MNRRHILGTRVDATSYPQAIRTIMRWAANNESRYVSFATVNNIMEAHDSDAFRRVMNCSDLTAPDGMPLVWGLRMLGVSAACRVYGPDFTRRALRAAEAEGVPVGFYGGSPEALDRLRLRVTGLFPRLKIVYCWSPPFRPLTFQEDAAVTAAINDSGARILFIGLNSPKQDFWMSAHAGRVHSVMLGVGAAFDFIAGAKRQAPRWVMHIGMEWFFRLATEPRRLWKRYLKHNPRFVLLFGLQLAGLSGQGGAPLSRTND